MINEESLRTFWAEVGGSFYGRNGETASIPAATLLVFLRELLTASIEKLLRECEGRDDAPTYIADYLRLVGSMWVLVADCLPPERVQVLCYFADGSQGVGILNDGNWHMSPYAGPARVQPTHWCRLLPGPV